MWNLLVVDHLTISDKYVTDKQTCNMYVLPCSTVAQLESLRVFALGLAEVGDGWNCSGRLPELCEPSGLSVAGHPQWLNNDNNDLIAGLHGWSCDHRSGKKMRRWEDEKMRLIRVEIVENTLYNARWNSGGCRSYASCESKQLSEPVICRHGFCLVRWIDDQFQWSIIHRIGLWEKLQESPIFDGKNHGFRLRFSLKPIQWIIESIIESLGATEVEVLRLQTAALAQSLAGESPGHRVTGSRGHPRCHFRKFQHVWTKFKYVQFW